MYKNKSANEIRGLVDSLHAIAEYVSPICN